MGDVHSTGLPTDEPLDGELWGGRGQFQKTLSVAKSQHGDANRWKNVTYAVFDAPDYKTASGQPATFERRMAYCVDRLALR